MKFKITKVEEVEIDFFEELRRVDKCFSGKLKERILEFNCLVQAREFDRAHDYLEEHFRGVRSEEHECPLIEFILPELVDIVNLWAYRDFGRVKVKSIERSSS